MTPSQTTSFAQSLSDVHSVSVQLPLLHSSAGRKAVDLSSALMGKKWHRGLLRRKRGWNIKVPMLPLEIV